MTHYAPALRQTLLGLLFVTVACDNDDADNDADAGTSSADGSTTADSDPTATPTTGIPDPSDPTSDTPTSTTTGETTDAATTDEPDPTSTSDSGDETGTDTDPTEGAACEEAPECEDQLILDLGLVSGDPNGGAVQNTADGDDWVSQIDATAGGVQNAPNTPWLYLRFTDSGLESVALDDLEALESDEWDIAAKRFGIRINSGSSGPSCVRAQSVETTYADLDNTQRVTPTAEVFYDDSCTLQDDGSGIGAPNYALTPWWFYPGCVGTTDVPFVIELDDGTRVKFVVESYYTDGQAECNENGAMGSGSANFSWRWAYLE